MTRNKSKSITMTTQRKVKSQVAPVARSPSFPKSSFSVSSLKNGIKVRGTEFIGSINTSTQLSVGTVLRNDYLCPSGTMFQGGRLPLFAQMYEKYLFKKVKMTFHSTVPSSTTGGILLAFDKDYADNTPGQNTGDDALRTYLSWENVNMNSVWNSFSLDLDLTDPQKFYYTNDSGYDGRLVYQGQTYIVISSGLPTASSRYGFYTADYEVEFYDPQFDNFIDYSVASQLGSNSNAVASGRNFGYTDAISLLSGSSIGIGKIVQRTVTDTFGTYVQKGFRLPPGSYVLDQMSSYANVNSAGQILRLLPVVTSLIDGSSVPVSNNIYPLPVSSTTNNNVPNIGLFKFNVPNGGADVYGSVQNTGSALVAGTTFALSDLTVRIIPSLASLLSP